MPQHPKTVIIISGPTASGKTALAIELAQYFKTAIISADSRQCYKELHIGVARPTEAELRSVPHFFIASHSLNENVTAKTFETYALHTLSDLFQSTDRVIVAGGTGLYLQALCLGLDDIPEIDPAIRSEIIAQYEQNGLPWLQQKIEQEDHLYFKTGEIQNPQRVMRALEVMRGTGQSILSFQLKSSVDRPFNILHVTLDVPVSILSEQISKRTHQMVAGGLLEEVKSLIPFRNYNALQTVGYTEMFDHLDGKITLQEAIEQVIIHTRQYAKRQRTWFRKNKDCHTIMFRNDMLEQIKQLAAKSGF